MYKIINKQKKFAVILIDVIGKFLFFFIRLFLPGKFEKGAKDPSRIVIIRFAYIGDMILTLPILPPLRKLYPHAHITLLTSSKTAPLLQGNPYIDEIMIYDAPWFYGPFTLRTIKDYVTFIRAFRAKNFTFGIDTRADIRNIFFILFLGRVTTRLSFGFGGGEYLLTDVVPYHRIRHKVDLHLELVHFLGMSVEKPEFTIYLTDNERREAEGMLHRLRTPDRPLIISLHPGARGHLKRWSLQNYYNLSTRILDAFPASILLLGDRSEEDFLHQMSEDLGDHCHSLVGTLTLRQLLAVIEQSSVLICNDSAPMHMGVALNVPTVTVFGPSKSMETGPYMNGHSIIEKNFMCRYECDETRCYYHSYKACLQAITVDEVFDAVSLLIDEHRLLKELNP